VLTHTRPWPPPGAGGFVAASALLLVAGRLAAAGLAVAELFGLNKSPSENLAGDGDAAGLAAAPAFAFLRPRLAFGEVAGDALGDAAVSAGDAVVGAPAGDSPVVGD
jgi:hypothetical protein